MPIDDRVENQPRSRISKAQHFRELWAKQAESFEQLPPEKRDEMGIAYLRNVGGVKYLDTMPCPTEGCISPMLGFSTLVLEAFIKGEEVIGGAGRIIATLRRVVELQREDFAQFWQDVAQTTPGVYSQKDLSWLAQRPGAATAYLISLATNAPRSPQVQPSRVIDAILTNMHAYDSPS